MKERKRERKLKVFDIPITLVCMFMSDVSEKLENYFFVHIKIFRAEGQRFLVHEKLCFDCENETSTLIARGRKDMIHIYVPMVPLLWGTYVKT